MIVSKSQLQATLLDVRSRLTSCKIGDSALSFTSEMTSPRFALVPEIMHTVGARKRSSERIYRCSKRVDG